MCIRDRLYTKIIVDDLGIRQADYVPVMSWRMKKDMEAVVKQVEDKFAYPVFVKPSNAGSSRGVSKAENREELVAGLWDCLLYTSTGKRHWKEAVLSSSPSSVPRRQPA